MGKIFQTSRGPVEVGDDYYLCSCDACGWIGSSEQCGVDSWGDDSDVYCPECFRSGADCGKEASVVETAAYYANKDRLSTQEGGR